MNIVFLGANWLLANKESNTVSTVSGECCASLQYIMQFSGELYGYVYKIQTTTKEKVE